MVRSKVSNDDEISIFLSSKPKRFKDLLFRQFNKKISPSRIISKVVQKSRTEIGK